MLRFDVTFGVLERTPADFISGKVGDLKGQALGFAYIVLCELRWFVLSSEGCNFYFKLALGCRPRRGYVAFCALCFGRVPWAWRAML